ncbi:cytosolic protein [Vibrio xuii]|nr:cytosolic protein [Vibrio xuii]
MEQTLPPYSDGVNLCLDELLYYKQQCVKWLPPAKSLWSQILGQHQSRQLGRGMDFSEVRQYQPGDDIRAIDWRVTARTGKPHTKLFSEEREKPVVLYLDFSSSMAFGSKLLLKSVQMAHMASLIAWLSVTQQDRIGAVIDTGNELIELKPTSRNRGALALLQTLVTCHQSLINQPSRNDQDISHALQALARLCPKGSEIILLSDFSRLTTQHEPKLSRLCQHNRVRMVQISDPLERGQTGFRGTEQVSNQNDTRWLDFSSRKTRQGIERAFSEQQQHLIQLTQKMGISFSSLSSEQALTQQLHGL